MSVEAHTTAEASTRTVEPAAARPRRAPGRSGSPAERLARWIVLRLLARIRGGELVIVEEGDGCRRFGEAAPERPLRAVVHVRSPRFYRELLRGSVGLCESYVEGMWECEDLVVAHPHRRAERRRRWTALRRLLAPVLMPRAALGAWLARNTPGRSRRRIEAHYDLGNELFALFLDPTMMYSCAVFEPPEATLEEASLAKLERVCRKLDLGPEDHVLEIGTGWGGFALHAAEHYGCRVTTTTISREQHAYAAGACAQAGLEDRVTVLLQDYRDLSGQLRQARLDRDDRGGRLAVLPHASSGAARSCVRADGAMLLQAIVIDDRAYQVEKARQELHQHLHLPRRLPALAGGDRAVGGPRDRLAPGPPGGHHRPLRDHAGALARALPRGRRAASPSSATTSASGGSGSSISATARAASASGASRTCSCCWPSPAARAVGPDGARNGARGLSAGRRQGAAGGRAQVRAVGCRLR